MHLVITTDSITQARTPRNHPSKIPQVAIRSSTTHSDQDQSQPERTEDILDSLAGRQVNALDHSTEIQIWDVILSFKKSFELFLQYLTCKLNVFVRSHDIGSLLITVECSSLQILEGLWQDYCNGHLTNVAQERLVTPQVLEKLGFTEIKLKTSISKEEYEKGKWIFKNSSGMSQTFHVT